MLDSPSVQELLDELLATQATPEEVCHSCPELLPRIRARWRQIRHAQAELDALFPPLTDHGADTSLRHEDGELPRIPGYGVEAILGQGGVGVVFRARHLRLGRPVALKMLLAGAYAGPTELARFQHEAEAVAALCHPNIVQLYEVGDHEGRPYFTMELVEGGTLSHKLAGAPQPVRWAAGLVAALAEAMSVAHAAGLVHRDLKPANVLLTADGTPKISDFGLARRLDGGAALTRTGTAVGTPSYMAPEQASGTAGPIGPAADVYGLGAILYELLTGRPPFRAATALETFRQVVAEEPVPPSRLNAAVPRDLETVCLKCLHKEPQRRYSGAAALAEDLRRYLLGQVVAARPVGRVERIGKWVRHNPTFAILSAAAVFALVTGTVASSLFAAAALRQTELATDRAGQLERQAVALEAEKRTAEENARRAAEKEREAAHALAEVERVLVAGLLTSIGRNANPLPDPTGPNTNLLLPGPTGPNMNLLSDLLSVSTGSKTDVAEGDALCQLRLAREHIRLRFLETALSSPEAARRVGRRADWVIQAIVGHDRALRAKVGLMVVQRIQEPGAPQETVLACARLGLALNLDDRAWAERSADAFGIALRDPLTDREDYPHLAESLAAVSEHLPLARAADHAARAVDVFLAVLRDPARRWDTHPSHGRAIVAVSRWLDAPAAVRAAEAIGAAIGDSGSYPLASIPLSETLAAVCDRLNPVDAAAHVKRAADLFVDELRATSPKALCLYHARALTALSGRLGAAEAVCAADALAVTLGAVDGSFRGYIAEALAKVAARLGAADAVRPAEALVLALRKSGNYPSIAESLKSALVSVCGGLDVAGTARVAEAVATAIRDPQTPLLSLVPLAEAFAALCTRLEPTLAGALEGAVADSLVASLADAKLLKDRTLLGRALTSLSGRLGSRAAGRAAETLSAVIRDPQTPLEALGPLATALAAVCGELSPADASSHASRAVDLFGSMRVVRKKPLDRASLAKAIAAVCTRLRPTEAAGHAKSVAADLVDALRDSNTQAVDLSRLTEALAVVCASLDPTEATVLVNSATDAIIAALRRPKNEFVTFALIGGAIAPLCAHLDQAGAARVADALITVLGDPTVQRHGQLVLEKALKNVATRLDERDVLRFLQLPLAAGVLQRTMLDVLGGSKNRSFRNTWDYLDWTKSLGSSR